MTTSAKGFALTLADEARLKGLHPDLVRVVRRAAQIADIHFRVGEGLRSKARQEELVKAGASRTMNSRHLTGHAVDLFALVDGKVRWDWPLYHRIAAVMKAAAAAEGVAMDWGGDWRNLKDGPHYELSWKRYPLPKAKG